MPSINLLPWRQEQRKEKQRQFFTLSGLSMALMVLIIVVIHINIERMISTQTSRNAFLERHIKQVEEQLKEIADLEMARERLLARMDIIQQLQRDRAEIVHLFDEVARAVPDGVHLTNFKQSTRSLSMKGVAQSNARVSSFMRNLDASEWLSDPNLGVIETDPKSLSRTFLLSAKQKSPAKSDTGTGK